MCVWRKTAKWGCVPGVIDRGVDSESSHGVLLDAERGREDSGDHLRRAVHFA